MSAHTYFILGIISGLLCTFMYAYAVFFQHSKPHLFTWLIWTITMGVSGFAQLASAGGIASYILIVGAAAAAIFAISSIWYGHREHTKSDWVALVLALSTIVLWQLTHTPLWSVILATTVDVIGYYPTMRKSWQTPHEEPLLSYVVGSCSMLCTVLALDTLSFVNWCYPVAIVCANLTLISLLLVRRHAKKTLPTH